MIIFDLSCVNAHRFEGWFSSAESFADQCDQSLVRCPRCDSPDVRRIPSAVHLSDSRTTDKVRRQTVASQDNLQKNRHDAAPQVSAEEAMVLYREAVRHLLASSENVGTRFADEARKIHYGETPVRSIHGVAEPETVEDLASEGIEVIQLLVAREPDVDH